ncbi:MAG TPA: CsbD family protein [Pseudonocardiaceae bacterium]|jgi:uncharacterized protein YjbJ (UPF0337 family)
MEDKINNKTEDLGGKAKEAAGNVTGDENLAQQGRNDQAKASVKNAVNDAKEGVKDAMDKVKNALRRD